MVDDLADTRATLDSRYDEIKTGRVKLVPGDEVFARLRARSAQARQATSEPSDLSVVERIHEALEAPVRFPHQGIAAKI
ncbi:MAG: hypothetical protein U0Q16_16385 [Bryobacteraceae bacterium]